MGHALNKVLKDIVVRSRGMAGYQASFRPGWDCHGLPIEVQLLKKLQKEGEIDQKHDVTWFRERCKEFALAFVDTQKSDFQRLGISARWDDAYLTLDPHYEATVIKQFGKMVKNGLIYKGKKPIHWCPTCETALAEAEIDYKDRESPSIYVRFKVITPSEGLKKYIGTETADLVVWTTTPWTLPANVALAINPDLDYEIVDCKLGRLIWAVGRHDALIESLELETVTVVGKLKGSELVDTETQHPFMDQTARIYPGHYVTEEDGSGFVHIAPGHGQEDYELGQRFDLPIVMPIDGKGHFTHESPEWEGQFVLKANHSITEKMASNQTLLKQTTLTHSYPHCWRCKKPVIFRATAQWFVAMDRPINKGQTLREKALAAVESTEWVPAWGQNRFRGMIENRPDWCISRQRSWGIPLPVFVCGSCEEPALSMVFNEAVQKLVEDQGAGAWFTVPVEDILPKGLTCGACGHHEFRKENAILDVWFESGASYASVLGDKSPADLYLEGSDQHRGWFQSSLLIGLGADGVVPYKAVLTHGFLVDEKGLKMSKSDGNAIQPQKVIESHGADILRWWVAGTDFKQDVSLSQGILNQARDSYMKVRNTLRFLLSNLDDFDPDKDSVPSKKLGTLDRWAIWQCDALIQKVRRSYDTYQFHAIVHDVHDFCAVGLSQLYLDMVKDRLYCDTPDSPRRRSTQTALYYLLDSILRLVTPIIVFTAEDVYRHFHKPDKRDSVHLDIFPDPPQSGDDKMAAQWQALLSIRDRVYQALEEYRKSGAIKRFLETKVTLTLEKPIEFSDWASFLIVSQVEVQTGAEFAVKVETLDDDKCQRCWLHLPLKAGLCDRCNSIVNLI